MSDDDEALNVRSESFDPLKALYSLNVRLPFPSAPLLDNISKYASFVDPQKGKQSKKKPTEPGPSTSGLPTRRFLPHQMPVHAPRPQRTMRDVLTRVQEATAGPLAVLRTCMQRRLRVKVYTRNMSTIRGHCEAFVAAFDKHWNLALEDVREVWKRKRRSKVPALDSVKPASNPRRLPASYKPPRVTVVSMGRGLEMCERHVAQLLIRGEQVVLVAIADYNGSQPMEADPRPAAPGTSVDHT